MPCWHLLSGIPTNLQPLFLAKEKPPLNNKWCNHPMFNQKSFSAGIHTVPWIPKQSAPTICCIIQNLSGLFPGSMHGASKTPVLHQVTGVPLLIFNALDHIWFYTNEIRWLKLELFTQKATLWLEGWSFKPTQLFGRGVGSRDGVQLCNQCSIHHSI